MAVRTWIGGADGTSFYMPDNWSPNLVPTYADQIVIDGTVTTTIGFFGTIDSFVTSGIVRFNPGLHFSDIFYSDSFNFGTLVLLGGNTTIGGTLANSGFVELAATNPGGGPLVGGALGPPSGGTLTLVGGGTINLESPSTLQGGSEIINVDNTISGNGSINTGLFVNQGTVTMAGSIGELDNEGLIDAIGYTAINLNLPGRTNTGLMEATGSGTLEIAGVHLDNNGGVISADGSGLVIIDQFATIAGGTLATPGNGTIILNDATLDGSVLIDNTGYLDDVGNELYLTGEIRNDGTILLPWATPNYPNDALLDTPTVTLGGTGVVVMGNSWIVSNDAPGTLVNDGNTIIGSGEIGPRGGGYNAVTLINNGTIEASPATLDVLGQGTAIPATKLLLDSAISGTGVVAIDPGATLELAQATAQAVTFNPSTVSGGIAVGGTLLLDLPARYTGTIIGLAPGDSLVLDNLDVSSAYVSGDTLVANIQGGGTQSYALVENVAGDVFQVTSGTSASTITATQALCFLAGTLLATPSGPVAVERLTPGDLVLTAEGQVRPVVWIGVGRVLATRGRRNAATPVIVRKGALAPNMPHEDLRVTKGHSFYLDGVLIPVEFLVNHRSILWDDRAQEVSVYHIELETHDVLLANGALAESYRDDGNRWLFRNANSGWGLPPREPCAPVLTGGPIVDAVWRRLLDRTGPRRERPTTEDPDLHLLVDGRRVESEPRPHGVHLFRLLRCPAEVRVVSRAGTPSELGLARDPRLLGVAVRQIRLWRGARLRLTEASDPLLYEGFHLFEEDNGFRWTDGDALLPATLFDDMDGGCELELYVASTTRYPLFGELVKAAAA
jgi:hypothetical protein